MEIVDIKYGYLIFYKSVTDCQANFKGGLNTDPYCSRAAPNAELNTGLVSVGSSKSCEQGSVITNE